MLHSGRVSGSACGHLTFPELASIGKSKGRDHWPRHWTRNRNAKAIFVISEANKFVPREKLVEITMTVTFQNTCVDIQNRNIFGVTG